MTDEKFQIPEFSDKIYPVDDFPLFIGYLCDGVIWYDESNREFVGKASDGIEVSFGNDPTSIEAYLRNRPTPDKW